MNKIERISAFLLIMTSLMLASCQEGVKDVDGNQYGTLKIGSQKWMTENLNVSRFRNGDSIPEVRSSGEWAQYGSEGKPACCIIQNDPGNAEKYGRLYNWFAVADTRGLAPAGWHVPSDIDWTRLTNFLGGGVLAAYKMKAPVITEQDNKTTGKNFSGLPAGARKADGNFYGMGSYGYWWSTTEMAETTSIRVLSYVICNINSFEFSKNCGLSVRCIKD
jgi:uncharacterized protein (TIGR02145 family)